MNGWWQRAPNLTCHRMTWWSVPVAHCKPPAVRMWRVRHPSRVGPRPPSPATPHGLAGGAHLEEGQHPCAKRRAVFHETAGGRFVSWTVSVRCARAGVAAVPMSHPSVIRSRQRIRPHGGSALRLETIVQGAGHDDAIGWHACCPLYPLPPDGKLWHVCVFLRAWDTPRRPVLPVSVLWTRGHSSSHAVHPTPVLCPGLAPRTSSTPAAMGAGRVCTRRGLHASRAQGEDDPTPGGYRPVQALPWRVSVRGQCSRGGPWRGPSEACLQLGGGRLAVPAVA